MHTTFVQRASHAGFLITYWFLSVMR